MDMLTRVSLFRAIEYRFDLAEISKGNSCSYVDVLAILNLLIGTGLFQTAGRGLLYGYFIHHWSIARDHPNTFHIKEKTIQCDDKSLSR